jgi:hypothetical protein
MSVRIGTAACMECGSQSCHRKIDEQGGAGRNPIPQYSRSGRKVREIWCDNGCNCEDCKEYWKKMEELQ